MAGTDVPALLVTGRLHAAIELPAACTVLAKPVSLPAVVDELIKLEV